MSPLLTLAIHQSLWTTAQNGCRQAITTLDLGRSAATVELSDHGWRWEQQDFPWLDRPRERTIYHWTGSVFEPVARFTDALYKLIPTPHGPPTFEIDGIKMLPSAHVSPYEDAARKVRLVQPQGKRVLDTCGGLGYFAAWCLDVGAAQVVSFEKNPAVVWLRHLNPWSPGADERLTLREEDCVAAIAGLPDASFGAILHDPPRFGIAGELYAQTFYAQLARVLTPGGRLFHYTGTPNALTSGRDVPAEVTRRLRQAGFTVAPNGDGLVAVRR